MLKLDGTLTEATAQGQRGLGSNGNQELFHVSQNSRDGD